MQSSKQIPFPSPLATERQSELHRTKLWNANNSTDLATFKCTFDRMFKIKFTNRLQQDEFVCSNAHFLMALALNTNQTIVQHALFVCSKQPPLNRFQLK